MDMRGRTSPLIFIFSSFFILIAAFETNKYVDDIAHFLSLNSY